MAIFIPFFKFLCLTMWLGGLCTGNANTDDDADADNDIVVSAPSMIV